MFRIATIVTAVSLWPGAAVAATMTFTALPDNEFAGNTLTEDGITATATWGGLGSFTRPGMAHIDDGGSSYASGIAFTTGGLFNADSVEIHALTSSYCIDWGDTCGIPFDNVVVEGWLDDVQVAIDAFSMGADWSVSTYLFGSAFDVLDRLVIRAGWAPTGEGRMCMDSPCAHFDIDNVTLTAAVPLPPTFVLLMSGIAAAFSVRLLRRPARVKA